MTYHSNIIKYISRLGKANSHQNPDQKSNTGAQLGNIYLWQTAKSFCDKQLKSAYAIAESTDLIPNKEKLREEPAGEYVIHNSKSFTLTSKISNPRKSFDQEEFMQRVAKKYKIPVPDLFTIALDCKKEGNPSVTLRVLEIE